jgi:hypothetical protein
MIMINFSPEDLLLFLYKEATPEMTTAIEAALKQDWTLREKLAVLKASQERLQTLIEAPRTESVLNILHYAAARETARPK